MERSLYSSDGDEHFQVAELFTSINGEGPLAGQLSVFVRFRGCNLECTYCDTAWANTSGTPYTDMTAEQICEAVDKEGIENVTLTGGEPLIRKGMTALIRLLCGHGHHVEVETNGSIDLSQFNAIRRDPLFRPEMLSFTMDYKLGDSGMEENMLTSNFKLLTRHDSVKFVSGSVSDLKRSLQIIDQYKLDGHCHIFISPVFGKLNPSDIVDFMKTNHLNHVNLQMQLHKIIWDPDMRGV